jgi:peptide/nickel transport system substrate-binding protein
MSDTTKEDHGIDRRKVLGVLGTTAFTGLAGCQGGGDGSGQDTTTTGDDTTTEASGSDGGASKDLGEQVPTVVISYQASRGTFTDVSTAARQPAVSAFEELGVDVEYEAVEFAAQASGWANDSRDVGDFITTPHGNSPDRLDPHGIVRRFAIDWAGGDGNSNIPSYASCEYSQNALNQRSQRTESDRRAMVEKAIEIYNQDAAAIPWCGNVLFNGIRDDEMNVNRTGSAGFQQLNPYPFIYSSRQGGDTYSASVLPVTVNVQNPYTPSSSNALGVWSHLFHSPLLEYNENYELQPVLAEDYEVGNDGKRITVQLRDASFHNGDPVTAEDVKFTFEHLAANDSAYPQAAAVPYESINAVDDTTVEFNFSEPNLPMITRNIPKWGILHKDTWVSGGAPDDPTGFQFLNNPIGSGPYEILNVEQGQFIQAQPFGDHPVHDAQSNLVLRGYSETNTAYEALRSNEIQVAPSLSMGFVERVENEISDGGINTMEAFMPYVFYPVYPGVPTKFTAFRQAFGTALDRVDINKRAFGGRSVEVTHAFPYTDRHPWLPDDVTTYTDDPSGDVEAARQVLEDAGWGWDDNGNLHYPPDADLEPLWPAGEEPSPDDFPCISDDGEWAG